LSTWKFKEGFGKNIGSIVGEFNTSRGLKPNKILIYGTPASGKSKLAETYAYFYQVWLRIMDFPC
jgi:lipid II:glycine glycyltransferase (peptidoglycan interpeptide bridge formation enzyme)